MHMHTPATCLGTDDLMYVYCQTRTNAYGCSNNHLRMRAGREVPLVNHNPWR